MYLSRIRLSLTERATMKALADLKFFHEALENCFPGDRPRTMWRIDRLKSNLYVLVLSEEKADFSPFCKKFSSSENDWEGIFFSLFPAYAGVIPAGTGRCGLPRSGPLQRPSTQVPRP